MKNKETGFICDWKYFMTHSCEKCPIARLCQEFEDKQKTSNGYIWRFE